MLGFSADAADLLPAPRLRRIRVRRAGQRRALPPSAAECRKARRQHGGQAGRPARPRHRHTRGGRAPGTQAVVAELLLDALGQLQAVVGSTSSVSARRPRARSSESTGSWRSASPRASPGYARASSSMPRSSTFPWASATVQRSRPPTSTRFAYTRPSTPHPRRSTARHDQGRRAVRAHGRDPLAAAVRRLGG